MKYLQIFVLQLSIITSLLGKSAEKTRQEFLFQKTKEFKQGEFEADKYSRREKIRSTLAYTAFAGATLTSYLAYCWYHATEEKPFDATQESYNAVTSLGAQVVSPFMLATLFSERIRQMGMELFGWARGMKKEKTILERVISYKIYIESQEDLPAALKEKIMDLLGEVEKAYETSTCFTGNSLAYAQEAMEKNLTGISYLLEIPYKNKSFGDPFNPNDKKIKKLQRALDEVKKGYPKEIQTEIDRLAFKITTPHGEANKTILYLYGPPGTGKTRLAEQLADAFDLPFVQMSASEKKLFADENSTYSDPLQHVNPQRLSAFTKRMLTTTNKEKEKFAQTIVFIDEIDKVLNRSTDNEYGLEEKLLRLLEPSRNSFRLHELDTEIDISKCIFIFAGNKLPDGKKYKALLDRVGKIHLKGFSPADKEKIAKEKFYSVICSMNQTRQTPIKLSKKDKETLETIIQRDKNPGVRQLLKILNEEYAYFLSSRGSLFAAAYSGEFDIDAAFSKHGETKDQDQESDDKTTKKEEEEINPLTEKILLLLIKETDTYWDLDRYKKAMILFALEHKDLQENEEYLVLFMNEQTDTEWTKETLSKALLSK